MAQMTLTKGVDTYTLPYPQTYQNQYILRANEFTSYTGIVSRDFVHSVAKFRRIVFMGWEELTTAEMININDAWMDMAQDAGAVWDFVDPNADTFEAVLNPENFNLQTQRFAGIDGAVLYTARLSLLVD
jgi:hypothetical protein